MALFRLSPSSWRLTCTVISSTSTEFETVFTRKRSDRLTKLSFVLPSQPSLMFFMPVLRTKLLWLCLIKVQKVLTFSFYVQSKKHLWKRLFVCSKSSLIPHRDRDKVTLTCTIVYKVDTHKVGFAPFSNFLQNNRSLLT